MHTGPAASTPPDLLATPVSVVAAGAPCRDDRSASRAAMIIIPILEVRRRPAHHPPWVKSKCAALRRRGVAAGLAAITVLGARESAGD